MSRTVLIFGDSNTRGHGVGLERRYGALLDADLRAATGGEWRVAVAHAASNLRAISDRFDRAIAKYAPTIIVWQCPTGPASYFVDYPPWIQTLQAVHNWFFRRIRERYIRADIQADHERNRTRRDAVYESRYLHDLYSWRLSRLSPMRRLQRVLAARYGTIVKTTKERFVERVCQMGDRLRAQAGAPILFLGLLPLSDDYYYGYGPRTMEWDAALAAALHRPDAGQVFLEVRGPLTRDGGAGLLLNDGTHLSPAGHRLLADAVLPTLLQLIAEAPQAEDARPTEAPRC